MKMLLAYGDRPKYGEWAANGMLDDLTVEGVHSAMELLPPPGADQPAYREVEVDLERFGRMMIAFRLNTALHRGKSSHKFWTACFARPTDVRGSFDK
jgi:hypothetical protein